MAAPAEITQLLRQAAAGDRAAEAQLYEVLLPQLRRIALGALRGRRGRSLQPTALVNELYLRLVRLESPDWKDRAHFLAFAACAMRTIVIDHARERSRQKRGGGEREVSLDEAMVAAGPWNPDVVDLVRALDALREEDELACRVVELRHLAGMTHAEIAHVLGVSVRTSERSWAFGRARLYLALSG